MRESRPSLLLRVALAIALPAYALDQASTQPIAPGAQVRTITRHSAAYGLTARQKQGFDLLQVAQAEAAGLPPTMRAFVLWQVSRGYRRVDSTKAEATLRRAFLTTLSIEDRSPSDQYCGSDFCYVRGRLQGPILEKLGEHSLPQIEKFLPSAEPEVRRRFTLRLIEKYISGKHFDHAMDLLDQVADDYPYEQVNQLMLALPAERAGDRLAIFTQALRHFDQDHRRSWTVGSDDLGTMIVRFWRQLPVPSVLDAVDNLLREAKPRGTTDGMQFTMSSGSNDVSLGSTYEYRLFQLLPVLRELEPMHAEDLLRENPKLRDDLQRLPDGMQSLSATYSDTPPAEGEGSEKPETSLPMLRQSCSDRGACCLRAVTDSHPRTDGERP